MICLNRRGCYRRPIGHGPNHFGDSDEIFSPFLILLSSCAARAEEGCPPNTVPREAALEALKRIHHEVPVYYALGDGPNKTKVFVDITVSPTETWTIVVTGPKGCSVPLASGTNWHKHMSVVRGKDS